MLDAKKAFSLFPDTAKTEFKSEVEGVKVSGNTRRSYSSTITEMTKEMMKTGASLPVCRVIAPPNPYPEVKAAMELADIKVRNAVLYICVKRWIIFHNHEPL